MDGRLPFVSTVLQDETEAESVIAGQHAPHRFPLVRKKVYNGHQLGNSARARAVGGAQLVQCVWCWLC